MTKKSKEDVEANKKSEPNKLSLNYQVEIITTHLILMTTNLGILFVFVGICAQIFSEERLYVFLFGLSCLLPIANGVLHYIFWKNKTSTIILIMSIMNLAWIVVTIVLLLIYRLAVTNSFFEDDIVFQFCVLFCLLAAIALAVFYYLVNQTLAKSKADNNGHTNKSNEEANKIDSKEKNKKKHKKSTIDSKE